VLSDRQRGGLGPGVRGRPAGSCAPTGRPRRRAAELIGVYHSHTHTEAGRRRPTWPRRPTREWHYVLVSLRDVHPSVRSWRIEDGKITEEPVVLQW
jgi:hypothetical protein